jgi:hypothetical protein
MRRQRLAARYLIQICLGSKFWSLFFIETVCFGVSETFLCSVFVPRVNIVRQVDARQLLMSAGTLPYS